jgi:hypothetical protein
MATFKIEIDCDNAAFEYPAPELADILEHVGGCLRTGHLYPNAAQWVRDSNGNRVGTYKYENRD